MVKNKFPLNIIQYNTKIYYPVYEFGGKYYVSEDGTSLYSNTYKRLLKNQINEDGYYYNNIMLNGKLKKRFLHRLIADSLLLKCSDRDIINHKNKNRKDNTIKNLEWVYRYENFYHGIGDNDYKNKNINHHRLFTDNDIEFIYTCGLKYDDLKSIYPTLTRWSYQDIIHDKAYKDITQNLIKQETETSIRNNNFNKISDSYIFHIWKSEYIKQGKSFKTIAQSESVLSEGVLKRRIKKLNLPIKPPGRHSKIELKIMKEIINE